jgi:hypothetical protein
MQFEQVVTAPIKSIDQEVREHEDTGATFYVARLEDQLVGDTLEVGGAVAISAETVDAIGMEALIGKRVKRWVRI